MQEGQPSRTAERVAERRAAHQLLDVPLILEDPLALSIIRPEAAASIRDNAKEFDATRVARSLRAFLVIRSRFAEDRLTAAMAKGVDQYVLLGAGFDTFAYRNRHAAPALTIYEIDHPATQMAKKRRLADANIAIPPNVTHVPVDFAVDSLDVTLKDAGFDDARPALFAWLGVVPYLDIEDIRRTLRYVASLAAGTAIIFDYGIPPSSVSWLARKVYERMADRVASIGEAWRTFFLPADLEALLMECGFSSVCDLGQEELTEMYLANRNDGLAIGPAGRIVMATV